PYEQEQPSFVSVLLSASSLDAAVQGFDDLTRAASSTGSVIDQAQAAQTDVARLSRALRSRAADVSRLERAAAGGAASLERAQSDRQALIDRLRNEQALNDRQLAAVQAEASAAVARAHTATLEASTASSPVSFGAQAPLLSDPQPPTVSAPTVAGPGSGSGSRTMVVSSTGYSLPGSTA